MRRRFSKPGLAIVLASVVLLLLCGCAPAPQDALDPPPGVTEPEVGETASPVWQPYADVDGDSNVVAYEYGRGYINVRFADGAEYQYTGESAGDDSILIMQLLADEGDGLNAYIQDNCYYGYVGADRPLNLPDLSEEPPAPSFVTCPACMGSGDEACIRCSGLGAEPCMSCQGAGGSVCSACGGYGEKICGWCSGAGYNSWNGNPCSTCYGTGIEQCWLCTGLGGSTCGLCGGGGLTQCLLCGGRGTDSCARCAGAGQIFGN